MRGWHGAYRLPMQHGHENSHGSDQHGYQRRNPWRINDKKIVMDYSFQLVHGFSYLKN
jgi:hypothetical protein